eukprot:3425568-Amphidinium_carterae.2
MLVSHASFIIGYTRVSIAEALLRLQCACLARSPHLRMVDIIEVKPEELHCHHLHRGAWTGIEQAADREVGSSARLVIIAFRRIVLLMSLHTDTCECT